MMSPSQQSRIRRGSRVMCGLTLIVAAGLFLTPHSADAGLLVSAYGFHSVLQYDQNTGASLGSFVAPGSGGLESPTDLAFGPDGSLYVADYENKILRFNGTTGAFQNVVATSGIVRPYGMIFGPDGTLYVSEASPSRTIVALDPSTGSILRQFGGGNLTNPFGLTFGPDGKLYVADYFGGVRRFDATTGTFLNVFVPGSLFSTVAGAIDLEFGTDKNLYVTDAGNNRVLKFNGLTGALIGTFASGGGVSNVDGLTFGPDGNLFVVSNNYPNQGFTGVARYNGTSGAFIDQFAITTRDAAPQFVVFTPQAVPEPSSLVSLALGALLVGSGAFVKTRMRK